MLFSVNTSPHPGHRRLFSHVRNSAAKNGDAHALASNMPQRFYCLQLPWEIKPRGGRKTAHLTWPCNRDLPSESDLLWAAAAPGVEHCTVTSHSQPLCQSRGQPQALAVFLDAEMRPAEHGCEQQVAAIRQTMHRSKQAELQENIARLFATQTTAAVFSKIVCLLTTVHPATEMSVHYWDLCRCHQSHHLQPFKEGATGWSTNGRSSCCPWLRQRLSIPYKAGFSAMCTPAMQAPFWCISRQSRQAPDQFEA